jgi:small-conductance mechanosensitive channel/CRP-like cAMP-binding protein
MFNWEAIIAEAGILKTEYFLWSLVVAYALVRILVPSHLRRLRAPMGATIIAIVLLPISAYMRKHHAAAHNEAHIAAVSLGILAVVWEVGTLFFGVIETKLRLNVPRIVSDLIVAAVSVGAIALLLSRLGINLSSLLATSAVVTAVLGLSLQDTLGNMIAGVTLQMDSSVRVGDWVKVGDVAGRVSEIRWRYTAIETRNWETVLVPNAQLMKGLVIVQGRREGQPTKWRRWVYFNVDFRYSPTQVIDAITAVLRGEPIANVASEPAPNCLLIDLQESYFRFAVRYWLTDLAFDDPTDSSVRVRIVNALKRENIVLSIPAHALFLTNDTSERREQKARQDLLRRIECLRRIELFNSLSEEEVEKLAQSLHSIPFAPGEVLTRQGAEAHWLYIVASGTVSVRMRQDEMERELAQLGVGRFFGEMGLLTGEARTATVVAIDEVECYRLGKQVFQELVKERPEIAQDVAAELARRRSQMSAAKEDLDAEAARERERQTAYDLMTKIRSFFGIDKAGEA